LNKKKSISFHNVNNKFAVVLSFQKKDAATRSEHGLLFSQIAVLLDETAHVEHEPLIRCDINPGSVERSVDD
jgi:hypothetical protein